MPESDLVQAAPAVASSKGLSIRGLWEVFTKPTSFFTELARSPKILVPFLVLLVLAAGFHAASLPLSLHSTSEINQEFMNSPQLSAEQRSQMAEQMKPNPITSYISSVAARLVVPLVIAALALFWGNFVFAGKGAFNQTFSIALYGEILYVVGEWVRLPLMLAKEDYFTNLSLAPIFAGLGKTNFLYLFSSIFSVFHIWELVVLAIGFAIVFGVTKAKSGLIAVLSCWILSVLQVLTIWIMFSMFS